MKFESVVISLSWWSMSISFTNWEAFELIPARFFPEMELAYNTCWLADWLKNKREKAQTLDSMSPLQPPAPLLPFNMAPLYISPWQLQCVCLCVCVCVWGRSHGSSATTSLRDSRHVQMVLVLALNEVPDTESRDLIGQSEFRVAVGEKPFVGKF